MTNLSSIPWSDVIAVGIRTSAEGPFEEDVFWRFVLRDGCFELPGSCVDGPTLGQLYSHLPGLDSTKIIRAMTSTRERIFRVWHREDSRFRPDRDALAARFRALVRTLGGDPEAAPAVFARVHAAWAAEPRRYHDLEHLVDCLRELDAATGPPTAELALWYHDVVYEPGATDCEERSAIMLSRDAVTLAIPTATATAAAAVVRATAHALGRDALNDATAELVLDIDLSILGRDPLRFMDYEYGIEEEYAPTSTLAFRRGRGHFLAALLERDRIFQTEHFRAWYEQPARAQIRGLLASPRYRASVFS